MRENQIGLQRDELLRKSLPRLRVEPRPASVNPNVASLHPPELLKSVPECCDKALCLRVAFGKAHQHSDPPHRLGLLRKRRERPYSSRTDNSFYENAPSHGLPQGLGPRQSYDYSRVYRTAARPMA